MTSYIILKFWPNLGLYVTLGDLFSSPKFSAIAKSCEFLVVMNYDRISKTLSFNCSTNPINEITLYYN